MIDGHLLMASLLISSVALPLSYLAARLDKRTGEKVLLLAMFLSSVPLLMTPLSPLILSHHLYSLVRVLLTHDFWHDLVIIERISRPISRWARYDPEFWVISVAVAALGVHLTMGSRVRKKASIEPPVWLVRRVKALADKMGVRAPKIVIADSGEPFAYAPISLVSGRIVLSVGLLESLERDEVSAVVAHEMSHLKHHDPLKHLFVRTLRMVAVANPVAHLMEPWVSRNEEYAADLEAAAVTSPHWMISALLKASGVEFQSAQGGLGKTLLGVDRFWMKPEGKITRVFSEHPAVVDRIENLMKLVDED